MKREREKQKQKRFVGVYFFRSMSASILRFLSLFLSMDAGCDLVEENGLVYFYSSGYFSLLKKEKEEEKE